MEELSLQERNRIWKKYYLECLVCEVSKILIFLLIFMAMGLTGEYMAALLTLMLLRNQGGGLHFRHYLTCLAVSFAFLYAAILLALCVMPSMFFMLCTVGLSIPAAWRLVPIPSAGRPPATDKQITRCRNTTVLLLLTALFPIFLAPQSPWTGIIYWTILLHILQLLLAKLLHLSHRYFPETLRKC